MILGQVFDIKSINMNLESDTKDEVFEELLESILTAHPEIDRADALAALHEREAKMSTGIGKGIAVPHGKTPSVKGVIGAVGRSKKGIDYEALDNAPVNLVFMLLTDPDDLEFHLTVLKRLSQLMDSPAFVSSIMNQATAQGAYDAICKFETLVGSR
jgi:PTS system fructose-specific IIC component/PTS system nitrogen regulatory IIA component